MPKSSANTRLNKCRVYFSGYFNLLYTQQQQAELQVWYRSVKFFLSVFILNLLFSKSVVKVSLNNTIENGRLLSPVHLSFVTDKIAFDLETLGCYEIPTDTLQVPTSSSHYRHKIYIQVKVKGHNEKFFAHNFLSVLHIMLYR